MWLNLADNSKPEMIPESGRIVGVNRVKRKLPYEWRTLLNEGIEVMFLIPL